MGILNNPAILRIRVPFQDFQPMEILNLELLAVWRVARFLDDLPSRWTNKRRVRFHQPCTNAHIRLKLSHVIEMKCTGFNKIATRFHLNT